MRYWIFICCN